MADSQVIETGLLLSSALWRALVSSRCSVFRSVWVFQTSLRDYPDTSKEDMRSEAKREPAQRSTRQAVHHWKEKDTNRLSPLLLGLVLPSATSNGECLKNQGCTRLVADATFLFLS